MKRRSLAQAERAADKERLRQLRIRIAELREAIREARASRRLRVEQIRLQCRTARQKLKSTCDRRREEARARGAVDIAHHADELGGVRSRAESTRRALRVQRRGPSIAERRAESDDQVRRDIPDELAAVWEHVKHRIKGTARRTRTEAFAEWVHDHPEDVIRIQSEHVDRDVARMVAEREAAEREAYEAGQRLRRTVPRARPVRRVVVEESTPIVLLEDVPF